MRRLDPRIRLCSQSWIAGSSPAMTTEKIEQTNN
jgi:hypothetical protein